MADAKKRSQILARFFIHDSDPKPAPRAGLDVNTIVFKYADDEETRVPLAPFFGGSLPPPSVGRAAAAFGINTSAGNTVGALDRERDPDTDKLVDPHPEDVRKAVEHRLKTFSDGRWASEAAEGGGPGSSLRMDTLIKFRIDVNKKDADEAWQATMRQKLDEDKEFWKNLMGDPLFRSVHETIKADRAAERAKKAAGDAAGAKSTLEL